jgi:rubrerythrin
MLKKESNMFASTRTASTRTVKARIARLAGVATSKEMYRHFNVKRRHFPLGAPLLETVCLRCGFLLAQELCPLCDAQEQCPLCAVPEG